MLYIEASTDAILDKNVNPIMGWRKLESSDKVLTFEKEYLHRGCI